MFGVPSQVVGLILAAAAAGLLLGWLIWGAQPRTDVVTSPERALSGVGDDSEVYITSNAAAPTAIAAEPRRDSVVALARMERYFGAPSNEFVEPVPPRTAAEAVPTQRIDVDTSTPPTAVDNDRPTLPSSFDDLKRIRGLGPTSERRLHELGIRSFQDLIDLDEDAFEHVRRLLGRRTEQDSWVEQARALVITAPLPARNGSTPK